MGASASTNTRKKIIFPRDPEPEISVNLRILRPASIYVDFFTGQRALTKYKDNEPLLIDITEKNQRTLGNDPETLDSFNNLAVLYHKQGKLNKAIPLYRKWLQKRDLGPDHPNSLIVMRNLAGGYKLMGKFCLAEAIASNCFATQKRLLGLDKETLETMNTLAVLYYGLQDWTRAEGFFKICLEKRKQIFGTDHLDTLKSMNNLALFYGDNNNLAEAEALFKECLECGKKMLGPVHPLIREVTDNLGELISKKSQISR